MGVTLSFWNIPVGDFKYVPDRNFLMLQKESGEEVEVEEFYVKYKNL